MKGASATGTTADIECSFCGPTSHTLHLPSGNSNPGWDLLRCGRCGLIRVRHYPSETDIAAYYQEQYYRGGDASRFPGPVEAVIRWFRLRRARMVHGLLTGRGAVLDVGCGRGLILAELKRLGYETVGTQLSETAAQVIRRTHGIPVHLGELPGAGYSDGQFDLVLMLHVLEHTTDPAAYLREIARILRPGGWFLVEVPNAGCLTARRHGLGWLHWDLPHHLNHFESGVLRCHLEAAGFRIERATFFSLEYGPFGILQAWLNQWLPGPRHYLYRALSGHEPRGILFLLHLIIAGLATAPAVAVALWRARRDGDGDIVTFLCQKLPGPDGRRH